MLCPKCGTENPDDARFCKECGSDISAVAEATPEPQLPAPLPPPQPPQPPQPLQPPQPPEPPKAEPPVEHPSRMSGLAIASLILGLLGPVTGLVGLVLGIVAMSQISSSEGRLRGRELAIAGICISGFMVLFIPILAAILFPVFGSAREKAMQASCLSNTKQIGLGMMMYAMDYDEVWLMRENWCDAVDPYIKNREVFRCPSAPDRDNGYAYNGSLSMLSLGLMRSPAETPAAFDATGGWNASGGRDLLDFRHNDGANIVFGDAHAKWHGKHSVDALSWQPPARQQE